MTCVPPHNSLDSLLRRARWQVEQCKARWLEARQLCLAAERQLQELKDYCVDYQAAPATVCRAAHLGHQHRFSERLKQAIKEQQNKQRSCETSLQQRQLEWLAAESELKALQQMQSRRQAVCDQRLARREQQQLDDLGLRMSSQHA